MTRVLSAAVLVAVVFAVTRYLPATVFLLMVTGMAVVAVWEFSHLARLRDVSPQPWSAAAGAAVIIYAFHDSSVPVAAALALVVVILPFLSLLRSDPPQYKFPNLGLTLFAAVFFGVLCGHLVALRQLSGGDGHDLPFLLLLVVAAGDTGAFYVGRTFGRHPLAPRLSPKKTVEGLVAGLICAVAGALIARAWFMYRLTLVDCLVLGLLLTVAGVSGDLVESMIKRWAGAKDSSALIPGHGGILNRIDALLFAAPVLFYYHEEFMSGFAG